MALFSHLLLIFLNLPNFPTNLVVCHSWPIPKGCSFWCHISMLKCSCWISFEPLNFSFEESSSSSNDCPLIGPLVASILSNLNLFPLAILASSCGARATIIEFSLDYHLSFLSYFSKLFFTSHFFPSIGLSRWIIWSYVGTNLDHLLLDKSYW